MSMRTAFWLLPLTLALAACSEAPPPAPDIRPVRSVVVSRTALNPEAAFSGEVRARYETPLGFRVAGKLARREVEVGQAVKKGQLLARLDPQDLELSAEAAKAQYGWAESDHKRAEADFHRYQELFARKLISSSEFKLRQTEYDLAISRLKQARAQYDVNANQAGYADLQAEFDGVVTRLDAEAGQVLAAGQPVAFLARPEELEVEISLPESRVEELRAAATVQVSIWAKPDLRFPGKIREIAPDTDPVTRTYRARVSVLEHGGAVQLGMTANVHLQSNHEEGMRLPLTAILQTKNQPSVWIVDDKTSSVRRAPVVVRRYLDNEVVVDSGIEPGQRVVTAGVHKLVPGEKVKLLEAR
ncbi:MAG: efflux RND transporter periplasmic adaptor subunit [Gammaproteobacteria bacterium]|nr:efflux RND transporter periplasmic adaptor subunit [Gammaproteobacteria bacterium]